MSVPPEESLSAGRILSHLGVMAAVAAVMGVIVAGLAIPFAGVLGVGARDVARSMDNLPTELETDPLPQKTTIVDAQGNTIATLYDENRINVPLHQISRTMVKAIVAIEDYRFYQHGALDLKGTLRALITNQANDGVVQGGSSITQQMVKLTLLSQAQTERERRAATDDTYARKIRELRYAIAFEEKYSKDWILERYLNIAYFGDGAYGVQAAARHYFDKNAKDLNLRESAMLAGLVKNPTGYDPTNNPDTALNRRNTVLDRMAELNVISREKAAKVKEKGLGLDVVNSRNGCVYSRAPFFCDYVLNVLAKDKALGKTPDERRDLLRSGGLTIRTTIDLRMQDAADRSVADHVYPRDQAIGGLAMVEPGTGDVKALAQSRPMGRNKEQGQTYLNYLVPQKYGDSAGFQAGSTFKAFVLASAISKGVPLRTRFNVPAQASIDMNKYRTCDGNYTSTDVWEPKNYDGKGGTFDLYTGTQLSVNTFYAQLELITGLCEPYKLAKSMGIDLTDPAIERVPSFTLGVVNTSPLEMAEAYATFAARGEHCAARPVTAIEDANGNLLKEYPSKCTQVLEQPVADAVNDILRGVTAPGGFGQYISTVQPDAGKTGTTQDGKSVWFVGYTPNLATAAMIAGANSLGQPIPLAGQTVGGSPIYSASGSGIAGPMWGDAMKVIEQWLDDASFVPPNTSAITGSTRAIPSTGGMSPATAQSVLQNAGFNAVISNSFVNSAYAYGTVAYTSPGSGTALPEGSLVTIYRSNGVNPAPSTPSGGGGGGGGNNGGGNNGGGNNGGGNGNGNGRGGDRD
ncbi:transglycosylase domain-containing protein [Nocardioides sp. GCM10027113]|uniref:transglycosylase domain-containing protein n=1 Tax=unclassified Nocardioides TaxID=2615069 RepID=UPI003610DB8D